jgi:dihydrofolate reductase
VHSPTLGVQLLRLDLIDEIDVHIAPVLLGDGIRLYDVPGGEIRHLQRDGDDHPVRRPALPADSRERRTEVNTGPRF